ncbi:MAG: DUF4292 domain-containing protein, partial [Planctomycetota bacterium]
EFRPLGSQAGVERPAASRGSPGPAPESEALLRAAPEDPAKTWLVPALSAAGRLQSLEAEAAMKAVDKTENISISCQVQLLVKRPGALRLSATKGLGTEIFDVSLVNDSIDIWLPRKRTFYRGYLRELGEDSLNFHPEEIIGQILLPSERLLANPWIIESQEKASVTLIEQSEGVRRNRLKIERSTGALLEREILNADGSWVVRVSYSRHKPLPGGPPEEPFPMRFEIQFPGDRRDLLLVLRKITPNPVLQPSDFWLPVPEADVRVKPLERDNRDEAGEALREVLADDGEPAQ